MAWASAVSWWLAMEPHMNTNSRASMSTTTITAKEKPDTRPGLANHSRIHHSMPICPVKCHHVTTYSAGTRGILSAGGMRSRS